VEVVVVLVAAVAVESSVELCQDTQSAVRESSFGARLRSEASGTADSRLRRCRLAISRDESRSDLHQAVGLFAFLVLLMFKIIVFLVFSLLLWYRDGISNTSELLHPLLIWNMLVAISKGIQAFNKILCS